MLEFDAWKRLGDRRVGARFTAGGGVTALFGPSGVGKTSILSMVAGLLRPDEGRILIDGDAVFAPGVDVPPEARAIGFVFQDALLFPHLTVARNLDYGAARARGRTPIIGFEQAVDLLAIGHLLARYPATLSGGEAKRVAIGRALLSAPRLLLMDEPLASLDAPRRADILAALDRIRAEVRLPILHVSHDRAEVDRFADALVTIDG
ncbi:molybdate transport system ATP-binding protein [Sphingomonas zeicaulis]|uniref:ATP-binding cassette domain-containing protein n=1 Tax=Sphingomonas zeicaulis TaxID=1632740 RepID=UPI003D1DA3DE